MERDFVKTWRDGRKCKKAKLPIFWMFFGKKKPGGAQDGIQIDLFEH